MRKQKYGEKRNCKLPYTHSLVCKAWWRWCHGMAMHGCPWNRPSQLYWWLNVWWPRQSEFGRVQNHLAYQYSRKCHQIHWEVLHIASGQWPKSQGIYKGKEMQSVRLPKSISRLKSDWTLISPAEEKSKSRNSPKQATIGIGCIEGWGKYFNICLLYLPYVQLSQYLCAHQWVGWTLKVLFF